MLRELKRSVYDANMDLSRSGLVLFTWGNVSGIDRERNVMAIKPSGVAYDDLKPEDIVLVDVESGACIEDGLKPSSDTPTHLELYRNFPAIGGVTHTHSTNAVAFAQAGMDIPALGTTHADYFYGTIPCSRSLTDEEVKRDYERNTGKVLVEAFAKTGIDATEIPGALARNHGPFAWGADAATSVFHAVVLEEVATMAHKTLVLSKDSALEQYVLDKHYSRKHGENAYYGQ